MKKTTQKKLSAFIMAAMMFSVNAGAQIVYTDVNPDSVILSTSHQLYNLDLNNDGITDFIFTETGFPVGQNCRGKTGISYAAVIRAASSGGSNNAIMYGNWPNALDSLALIDSNASWSNDTTNKLLYANTIGAASICYPPTGIFNYTANKYIGLKFIKNGNSYYGWARIFKLGYTSMMLTGYAFNSIPNQPILAGEISCATPTINLTQSGPLSFCAGDSVTLTANCAGYQYQWKKNNINIAGATAKKYVAKTAGVYKCRVTNSCGSKTSGKRTVTVPCRNTDSSSLGMTSAELEHLSVFPNPATNSVTIKFPSDEEGQIQILNLFGQIVFSEKVNAEQEPNLPAGRQVDVSRFSAGMYVVRWSSGENNETKKFSVIK